MDLSVRVTKFFLHGNLHEFIEESCDYFKIVSVHYISKCVFVLITLITCIRPRFTALLRRAVR